MNNCGLCKWIKEKKKSRGMSLLVVFLAILVDRMFLTVVAPIIPIYLYEIELEDKTELQTNVSSSSVTESLYSSPNNRSIWSFTDTDKDKLHQSNMTCKNDTSILNNENLSAGLLLASKAMLQLLFNPLTSQFTYRTGFDLPMFLGFIITFLSILVYAFAQSYTLLFVARSFQGVGSALTFVAGMGVLATKYTDDKERGEAMAIVVVAIGMGLTVGPPFGSFLYHFVGKTAPFLVLAGLAFLDGALQLFILKPTKISPTTTTPPSFLSLMTDPYIIVTAGSLFLVNMSFAMLDTTLPIWMLGTMCSPDWMLGVVFLPTYVLYLIVPKMFVSLSVKIGRWLCCLLGLVLGGISYICVPLAVNIYGLIAPIAVVGLTVGLVDISMIPMMGFLVDLRHSSVYGGVYAITDIAYCLGFAIGPSVGGAIAKTIGFPWLMRIVGLVNILFAPVSILLRNPPAKEETTGLTQKE